MEKSVIYTKDNCKFCVQAKAVMNRRGIAYEEKKIQSDSDREELLNLLPHIKTLPQIFISGVYVGGATELQQLEDDDRLFINKAGNVIIQ